MKCTHQCQNPSKVAGWCCLSGLVCALLLGLEVRHELVGGPADGGRLQVAVLLGHLPHHRHRLVAANRLTLDTQSFRAGNEPSQTLKFHNHRGSLVSIILSAFNLEEGP